MIARANVALSRFNPAQPGAQGMKVVATGLLVVMAGVFAVARAFEPHYPWLSYVKAFAEAAMVGGLADWFAVTALVPPSARPADPAHRDHPAQQGPDRRSARQLHPREFPYSLGRCEADAALDVAGAAGRFLQTPAGEGTRSAPAPRASSPTSSKASTTNG